jgi:hypothetical protein
VFRIALAGANENANATGDFDVTGDLVIKGAGAGLTAIDARHLDRAFDLAGGAGVRFAGVTLRNGSASDTGGAVRSSGVNVALFDCVVTNNRASFGGGIGVENANARVVRSAVVRNASGSYGGGVGVDNGKLTVTGSSVRRNAAAQYGGGLFGTDANLVNRTLDGNYASSPGGGVYAPEPRRWRTAS